VAYGAGSDTASVGPSSNPYNPFGHCLFRRGRRAVTLKCDSASSRTAGAHTETTPTLRAGCVERAVRSHELVTMHGVLYTITMGPIPPRTLSAKASVNIVPWPRRIPPKAYKPVLLYVHGHSSSAGGRPTPTLPATTCTVVRTSTKRASTVITAWRTCER